LQKPKIAVAVADNQDVSQPDQSPKPLYAPPIRSQRYGMAGNQEGPAPTQSPKPRYKSKKNHRSVSRRLERKPKSSRKLRLPVVIVAAVVPVLTVVVYIFVVPLVYSEEAEPKTVLAALEKLRRMPSSEPGLTIDARLARDLDKSKLV